MYWLVVFFHRTWRGEDEPLVFRQAGERLSFRALGIGLGWGHAFDGPNPP